MKRLLGAFALVSALTSAANASPINYALSSQGASVTSVSSAIGVGNFAVMEADLLTDTKTPWHPDGDTRYIFGNNDANQSFIINLGALRLIDTIGASIDRPQDGDRPVLGPITFSTSLDGSLFTPFGLPVPVTNPMSDPVSVSSGPVSAQFVQYSFGPTPPGNYYGNFGGSAVNSIFADATTAVPEPMTLSLFGAGLAGLGVVRRRRKSAKQL